MSLPMPCDDVLIQALVSAITRCLEEGVYGVLVSGVERVPVRPVVEALGSAGSIYVSLIGGDVEQIQGDILWARRNGWDDLGFGTGATHAVWVRNEAPPDAIKVAFVWREEERLHSLTRRGYVSVGPQQVVSQICRIAKEASTTTPEQNLWEALSSRSLATYATLDGILAYYEGVMSRGGGEIHDAPRVLLPKLGFLPDPELLTGRYKDTAAIVDRLIKNGKIVERIQRADRQDRSKALNAARNNVDLREQYHAFLRISNNELDALCDLPLTSAERLLGERPTPGAGPRRRRNPGGGESRRQFASLEEAAFELVANGESDLLSSLLEDASEYLRSREKDNERLEAGDVSVKFAPSARALSLSSTFVGKDRFGGRLRCPDKGFEKVMDTLGESLDDVKVTDRIDISKLSDLLPMARTWAPGFEADRLMKDYLAKRELLLDQLSMFAVSPLPLLIGRPELAQAAGDCIGAYHALLSNLEEHFGVLRRKTPDGAAQVYNQIFALDTIRLDIRDESVVLLSPVHPLVLWKYVELASIVVARGTDTSESDRDLLSQHLTDLPEPLLALFVPGQRIHEGLQLGYSDRVGSLPVYRQASVVATDPKESSIRLAATKLSALYPSVKNDLRIMLLNPVSTQEVAHAVRNLILDKGFARTTIVVAQYSRRQAGFIKFSHLLDELAIEDRVVVEEKSFASLEDLTTYLGAHPVHLMVMTGEKTKNVEVIASEGTRLHPLSLPHKMCADPWVNKLRLEPRSIQPGEGARQHPFGVFQKLLGQMAGNHESELSQREALSISLGECKPFLPYCHFVLIAGDPRLTPGDQILRLSHDMDLVGDTVVTAYTSRILKGIEDLLRGMYYHPSPTGVKKLLGRLQEVGGEGIFATISDSGTQGFSGTALRGQLGLAVALDWYHGSVDSTRLSVISLDGYLARSWLKERDDEKRNDLLVMRQTPRGSVEVCLLEVKGYQATSGEDIGESHPGQQLRSVARVIYDILNKQGDLLVDRRRELLRLQMYREGFRNQALDSEWVELVDNVLDGNHPATLDLRLIEVVFDDNLRVEEQQFPGAMESESPIDRLPISRVRLGEAFIQEHMGDFARRPQNASGSNNGGEGSGHAEGDESHQSVPDAQETQSTGDHGTTNDQSQLLGFEPSVEEHQQINQTARRIYQVLREIGVRLAGEVDPSIADVGPSIVRYKIRLQTGERIANLQSRSRDLMRELATSSEPIIDNLPNTNFVYIDLPRPNPRPAFFRPVLQGLTRGAADGLVCPIGVTPDGQVESLDLTLLPHMLVAGSTGSGKTMFLYSLLVGLTHLYTPQQVELVLVDPKQTDFVFFGRLPHLQSARVITDAQEAITVLMGLLTEELMNRTSLLTEARSRDIRSYNTRHPENPVAPILVVIDEFADLADVMNKREREQFDLALKRLAQRARNVGIHLVIATQRPTTDIVNGTLKTNLPCRVSFKLASNVDSRTILDRGGAENLLGHGDMLISNNGKLMRLQGFFLPESDMLDLLP